MTQPVRPKVSPEIQKKVISSFNKGAGARTIAAKLRLTVGQVAGILRRAGASRHKSGIAYPGFAPEVGSRRWAYANYLKSQIGARDALRALEDDK